MDNPVGAIRYAIRQFRLSPVFTASAVLTLSLGIGGTTAIFTLIHAVMLRSLPVADPERLYRVGDGDNCCVQGGPQDRWGMFSYPLFERLKVEAPEFEQLTAFQAGGFRVSVRRPGVDVAARSLRSEYVTGNYFTTFGIGAFGGRVFARLKPGATTDGIAPRLTSVLRQWIPRESNWPPNWLTSEQMLPKQTIALVPAGAGVGVMKEQYAGSLQLLMAVCGLVLLIACANVANLLLARSVARRTQTAVRMAIGASRSQIVTQALVESILLAIGGGIAGLVVAMGAARLLLSLAFSVSTFLPISTRPSPLVLAFAFGVAVITGVLFGAVPAWLATRTDPIDALRGSGRSTGDHSSFTRTALLVLQATLSVVLVAGATMLGRSLNNVQHQDFGFTVPDRVLVAINRPSANYTVPQLTAMYRTLEDRLNRIPGVQSANLALYNPLTDNWGEPILVAGHPRPMFYVPLAQKVNYVNSVMTRVEYQSHFISGLMLVTKLGPGALEPLVTKAMADVDPSLTFMNARTLEQQIALTFDQERAVASLAGLFGGVSLLLAAIGLYGVTAYSVAQRTNEIGIRMALGADKGAVLNLVLRSAFTRVATGLGLGVPLAIGAGKLLAAQLYGVKFWDPVALAVATGSLTLCALVAALIPGTRAASIPPMHALRLE